MKYSNAIGIKMERQVLVMLIENDSLYYENHQRIHKRLFTQGIHIELYEAFEKLRDNGEEIDVMSLAENISSVLDHALETVSGIISSTQYDMSFDKALTSLIAAYKYRSYLNILEASLSDIKKGKDISDSIEGLEAEILSITADNVSEVKHVSDAIDDVFDHIEKSQQNDGNMGVDTGFLKIDEHTGGWQKGDLIILAGKSSMGKTSFALCSMLYSALKSDHQWGFYSLEMTERQLTSRLLSINSNINGKDIQLGRLNKYEVDSLRQSSEAVRESGIYIDKCSSSEFSGICNSIRRLHMAGKLDIAVIDYLQLVSATGKNTREQEIAHISRGFKNLALELDIPVILLSQLSRATDTRGGDKRPQMSDLRDSGQIEEAADIVVFVYRPEYYGIMQDENGESTVGYASLIFSKGRNVGLDTIRQGFLAACTKFHEV